MKFQHENSLLSISTARSGVHTCHESRSTERSELTVTQHIMSGEHEMDKNNHFTQMLHTSRMDSNKIGWRLPFTRCGHRYVTEHLSCNRAHLEKPIATFDCLWIAAVSRISNNKLLTGYVPVANGAVRQRQNGMYSALQVLYTQETSLTSSELPWFAQWSAYHYIQIGFEVIVWGCEGDYRWCHSNNRWIIW